MGGAVRKPVGDPAEALALLGDQLQPVSLAIERRLPVLEPLESLLPWGLQRGSTVVVSGPGSTSLVCVLTAAPLAAGAWAAVVGVPSLGLVAAEDLGVPLQQVVLVDQPSGQDWGTVVAALVDAFEVVVVGLPGRVSPRDTRRIEARARERGGVVIGLGPVGSDVAWPTATDLVLRLEHPRWRGLDNGHGVLSGRRLTVVADGRRGFTRTRRLDLWLPDASGTVRLAEPPQLELVRDAS